MVKQLAFISLIVLLATACNHSQSNNGKKHVKATSIKKVAFILYENFDTVMLNTAIAEVKSFYHCDAIILSPQDLPGFAYYKPRYRYKADSLLKFQSGLLPSGSQSVIGLTNKDISTATDKHEDWGIFGLGYCPGKACVISVFRLQSGPYDLYKERFIKVLLHELGHNMGLTHCNYDSTCMMNDARGTMAQVDLERKWLCPNCKKLLSN